jgi:hypothetical protein
VKSCAYLSAAMVFWTRRTWLSVAADAGGFILQHPGGWPSACVRGPGKNKTRVCVCVSLCRCPLWCAHCAVLSRDCCSLSSELCALHSGVPVLSKQSTFLFSGPSSAPSPGAFCMRNPPPWLWAARLPCNHSSYVFLYEVSVEAIFHPAGLLGLAEKASPLWSFHCAATMTCSALATLFFCFALPLLGKVCYRRASIGGRWGSM